MPNPITSGRALFLLHDAPARRDTSHMAEHISDSEARELIHERNRAEGKLSKIADEGKAMAAKALIVAGALGTGFVLGAVNVQKGATSEAPYSLGGKVPLDAAAAIAGTGAIFLAKKSTSLALAAGIGGGALGCWGQRLGAAWEQARLTAAGTAPATTTAGRVGHRGAMAGRLFGPGAYESDLNAQNPWMYAQNPYVEHFAGPAGRY
jgi:hypothetical protein